MLTEIDAMMKSNGFGRFQQKVIVHVAEDHARAVAEKLRLEPFKTEGDPARAYFEWTRLTARPGNDQDVVWDLAMMLGESSEPIDWHIDWSASTY